MNHGFGCLYSESGLHKSEGNNDECIYCGSTNYGYSCLFHGEEIKKLGLKEKAVHVHGHGKSVKDGKSHCIYCGKTDHGNGCLYSPDGKHHF